MCPAACPEPCPWGLSVGLDLGNDTLWKAPNMLSAWLWTQRCSSGGGGRDGKGGGWQQAPLLLETEIAFWPLLRPPLCSLCSHQSKNAGSWPHCVCAWEGTVLSKPREAQVLCPPRTLRACTVLTPHVPAGTRGCPPCFPLPAVDSVLPSLTAQASALKQVEQQAWLTGEEQRLSSRHMVQEAASPVDLSLCPPCAC